MMRGSTELLRRSVRHLIPLIETIAEAPKEVWEIDAHAYTPDGVSVIFDTADRIRTALGNKASDTLVTKIMLGTFGCIPAFDNLFRQGFGCATFGAKALRRVGEFYVANRAIVERNRVATLDFASGSRTNRRYTRAKVIDMIFFVQGRGDV